MLPTLAPVPVQSTWSADAARDRLSSTGFLAALFHGILILGITFTATTFDQAAPHTALEVVLVNADFRDWEPAPSAVLLAQQNLIGVGNAPPEATLKTGAGPPQPASSRELVREPARLPRPGQPTPPGARAALVLTPNTRPTQPWTGLPDPGGSGGESGPERGQIPMEVLGRLDSTTAIPDALPRELQTSANTRESGIATYLSTWKNKVEQVGTLHFPLVASQTGIRQYPVLEVAIGADGHLRGAVVRISSGQAGLDEAALEILKMAAPFAPFPADLRARYDVLRFAYEWRFSAGAGPLRARRSAAVW